VELWLTGTIEFASVSVDSLGRTMMVLFKFVDLGALFPFWVLFLK
jgi:hypothetical protein